MREIASSFSRAKKAERSGKESNWPAEIYETSNAGDARSEEEITFSRPWLDLVYLCFFSFPLFFSVSSSVESRRSCSINSLGWIRAQNSFLLGKRIAKQPRTIGRNRHSPSFKRFHPSLLPRISLFSRLSPPFFNKFSRLFFPSRWTIYSIFHIWCRYQFVILTGGFFSLSPLLRFIYIYIYIGELEEVYRSPV